MLELLPNENKACDQNNIKWTSGKTHKYAVQAAAVIILRHETI